MVTSNAAQFEDRFSTKLEADAAMALGSVKTFDFLNLLQRASLIGLVRAKLIDVTAAHSVAVGIQRAIDTHDAPETAEALDYLNFEQRMESFVGPICSLLHIGRSRQDILTAILSFNSRTYVRDAIDGILALRQSLLKVASKNLNTIIPVYVPGEPAKSTTMAHYLVAFDSCLQRDLHRFEEAYSRVNRSPMGAEVNSTSRFQLDRQCVSDLLGFDGIIENAYDANHGYPVDTVVEVAQLMVSVNTHISQLLQDINLSQTAFHPWLQVGEDSHDGVSHDSDQPAVAQLRDLAAIIEGRCQSGFYLARNMNTGMTDVRETVLRMPSSELNRLLTSTSELVLSLKVDEENALVECSRGRDVSSRFAEVLNENYAISLESGAQFYRRIAESASKQMIPTWEIPTGNFQDLFASSTDTKLPVPVSELRKLLRAKADIRFASEKGGPHPTDVGQLLLKHSEEVTNSVNKSASRKQQIADGRTQCLSQFQQFL